MHQHTTCETMKFYISVTFSFFFLIHFPSHLLYLLLSLHFLSHQLLKAVNFLPMIIKRIIIDLKMYYIMTSLSCVIIMNMLFVFVFVVGKLTKHDTL